MVEVQGVKRPDPRYLIERNYLCSSADTFPTSIPVPAISGNQDPFNVIKKFHKYYYITTTLKNQMAMG